MTTNNNNDIKYYVADLDRAQCENRLSGKPEGTLVFRDSSKKGQLVLSVIRWKTLKVFSIHHNLLENNFSVPYILGLQQLVDENFLLSVEVIFEDFLSLYSSYNNPYCYFRFKHSEFSWMISPYIGYDDGPCFTARPFGIKLDTP